MIHAAAELSRLSLAGELDVPMPGSGSTRQRWQTLRDVAYRDTVLGRLAEAHTDALAILAELSGPEPEPGQIWGVWAAEPPEPRVDAREGAGGGWTLTGRKLWCSGASICTHALMTARVGDRAALFAVDLTAAGVHPVPDTWHAIGMQDSDSGAVDFDEVPAVAIGTPGEYLTRPGFWHGAIGVAACWYGSACAVAEPLLERARKGSADAHTLAHLGAVDAALASAKYSLDAAAREIDDDPFDQQGGGQSRAQRVRAIVEDAATQTLHRVGRALGAGPLCMDIEHARRVADLTVYLRQSHAERDLASLGSSILNGRPSWS